MLRVLLTDRRRRAVHRVGPAVAAAFLYATTIGAQRASTEQAPTSPIGTWRGTSRCLVRPSSCNDETVVYRITRGRSADSLMLDARKLVRGTEEEMGVLTCHFTPRDGALSCDIPRGTWRFRVGGDSLLGELLLTDASRFREVQTVRAPHE